MYPPLVLRWTKKLSLIRVNVLIKKIFTNLQILLRKQLLDPPKENPKIKLRKKSAIRQRVNRSRKKLQF